jgi:hypothetical protein
VEYTAVIVGEGPGENANQDRDGRCQSRHRMGRVMESGVRNHPDIMSRGQLVARDARRNQVAVIGGTTRIFTEIMSNPVDLATRLRTMSTE